MTNFSYSFSANNQEDFGYEIIPLIISLLDNKKISYPQSQYIIDNYLDFAKNNQFDKSKHELKIIDLIDSQLSSDH